MNRRNPAKHLFLTLFLVAGGCGAVPDLVVESARSAAKEAVESAVADIVDDAFQRVLDAGDDLLPLPLTDESGPQSE
jgi:hypothetical protein